MEFPGTCSNALTKAKMFPSAINDLVIIVKAISKVVKIKEVMYGKAIRINVPKNRNMLLFLKFSSSSGGLVSSAYAFK